MKYLDRINRLRSLPEKHVLAMAVGLFAIPILIDLLINGWQRVFSYFAADTFYYTTVARHFADGGVPSFDGSLPTNGFHPAWQVILGVLYKTFDAVDASEAIILTAVMLVSVVLISVAIVLIWEFVRRDLGRVPIIFILIPIGILGPAIAWTRPQYDTLWSYANGMETPLLLLIGGWCCWEFNRKQPNGVVRSCSGRC